ncbi:hypothetical protein [Streptomyces sp. NPDC127084]
MTVVVIMRGGASVFVADGTFAVRQGPVTTAAQLVQDEAPQAQ